MALQADRAARCTASTVRASEDFCGAATSPLPHYPGGQLVQEIDMAAPVRGARILLTDGQGLARGHDRVLARADGMETYVLEGGYGRLAGGRAPEVLPNPIRPPLPPPL